MSHAPLQGEHVAAVAEVLDGELVPEVIGGEPFQTGLLSIAAELDGPGVGRKFLSITGTEHRHGVVPLLRPDLHQPIHHGGGLLGEEDGPCLTCLGCGGTDDGAAKVGIHVGRAELQGFGGSYSGIEGEEEQGRIPQGGEGIGPDGVKHLFQILHRVVNDTGRLAAPIFKLGGWRFGEGSFPRGELEEGPQALQPHIVGSWGYTVLGEKGRDALPAGCGPCCGEPAEEETDHSVVAFKCTGGRSLRFSPCQKTGQAILPRPGGVSPNVNNSGAFHGYPSLKCWDDLLGGW